VCHGFLPIRSDTSYGMFAVTFPEYVLSAPTELTAVTA